MAPGEQVLGSELATVRVVDRDARQRSVARVDQHDREAGALELLDLGVGGLQRDDQGAVDAVAADELPEGVGALGGGRRVEQEQVVVALALEPGDHAAEPLVDRGARHERGHDADRLGAAERQVARGRGAPVAELVDRPADPLAGLVADQRAVVEHARDGSDADVRVPGHVADRESVRSPLHRRAILTARTAIAIMEPVPFEMLGTLIRAGDVLDLFTVEEPEWGVTATAQRLGIGKSLAHEALATLTEIGLLQRIGHGRYRLGWRTMSLASVLLRTSAIGTCARPVIRDLVELRGLGVSLVAWDRGRIVYINRHQRRVAEAAAGPVAGTTLPADDSAPAKVLLASRPAAEVMSLWGRGDLRTRHDTLLGLIAELAEVRRVGWAHDGHPAPASPRRSATPTATSPPPSAWSHRSRRAERDLHHHASLAVAAAARISEAMRSGSALVRHSRTSLGGARRAR